MTDIDTIREALEHEKVITRLKPDYFRMLPDAQGEYVYFGHQQAALTSALAALERVSALNSEMELALDQLKIETLGWNSKKPPNRPMTNVERIFAKLETKR